MLGPHRHERQRTPLPAHRGELKRVSEASTHTRGGISKSDQRPGPITSCSECAWSEEVQVRRIPQHAQRFDAQRRIPHLRRGPFGGTEKTGTSRSRGPEVLYIGVQMGANFGPEYQEFYKERFVDSVNAQLQSWKMWDNVKEWGQKARTSMFRTGLGQITDDGTKYSPVFDLNAMDDWLRDDACSPFQSPFWHAMECCGALGPTLGSP